MAFEHKISLQLMDQYFSSLLTGMSRVRYDPLCLVVAVPNVLDLARTFILEICGSFDVDVDGRLFLALTAQPVPPIVLALCLLKCAIVNVPSWGTLG